MRVVPGYCHHSDFQLPRRLLLLVFPSDKGQRR